MSAEARKDHGGSQDPNKKKEMKKPSSGPSKKPAAKQSRKLKSSDLKQEAFSHPEVTVTPPSPPQTRDKGKDPDRESRRTAPPLPAWGGMPKTPEAAARVAKYSTEPIPPPPAGVAAMVSKSRSPAGTHKGYPAKGLGGSLSDRSESEESTGHASLSTTAYTEPLMEYEVKGRKLKNGNELVSYLMGGRFFRARLLVDGEKRSDKPLTALMLHPGQGGTFGFGYAFWKNSEREVVTIGGIRKRAQDDNSIVKHLLYYGEDISMIGTSRCISCVGVYFELEGNRVFCAHINALHHEGREKKPDMKPNSKDYFQMKEMMRRRFEGVSKRDGWTRDNYLPGTLKLVCPNKRMAGYAVVEAINEFLGTQEIVEDSPGFVFTPGLARTESGPRGRVLLKTHTELDGNRKYEGVPNEIQQINSTDSHGDNVIQPWTYTTGPGSNRGWNWAAYTAGTIIRSRPNSVITNKEEPGFLSAK